MKKSFLAICLLAVLAGCSTNNASRPLPMVDHVDLDRFMGTWYVVSSVPSVFDRKPHNTKVVFARAERGITIDYTFNSAEYNGEEKRLKTNAMVDNPGINSDWHTTYPWPFARDIKIVYLEPDYSVAVLAHPNRKDAWVLSRSKEIDPPLLSDIILYLQSLGFDVGKMRIVPQG